MSKEPRRIRVIDCQTCGFVGMPMDATFISDAEAMSKLRDHLVSHDKTTGALLAVFEEDVALTKVVVA